MNSRLFPKILCMAAIISIVMVPGCKQAQVPAPAAATDLGNDGMLISLFHL